MSVRLASAERFDALWRRSHPDAGAHSGRQVYDEVVARYAEPQRHYHTLEHVDDCLARLDLLDGLLRKPDAVELALWFHDVIYQPGAPNNERRSAELYLSRATGAPAIFCRSVCSMILVSQHMCAAQGDDRRYVVDIDLAGFGLPWNEFRRQSDLVRAEFPGKSDAAFVAGLAPFLGRLLARPRLFVTDFFHDRWEASARDNIAHLLDEWQEAGYVSTSV